MPKNTVSTSTSTRKTTDLKFPIKNDGTKMKDILCLNLLIKTEKKICVQHQRVKEINI